jgi:hypothetical protein
LPDRQDDREGRSCRSSAPVHTHYRPAERLRQSSVDAGTDACAGAGAGTCVARPRQNEDRDVLKEGEKEEEEEEEDKDIELMELIGDFDVIEEERRDAERLESVLVQALTKTHPEADRTLRKVAGGPGWRAGEAGEARGSRGLESQAGGCPWPAARRGGEGARRGGDHARGTR